jgi:hypothetical protein
MPTIPRTDFYLQFNPNAPNYIWIDGSDLGDSHIPHPILPETFSPDIYGWESHWYPILTEIRKYTANRLGGNPSHYKFVTDDQNLFKSYRAYQHTFRSDENEIIMAARDQPHPDPKHFPYIPIRQGPIDQRYIDEQKRLGQGQQSHMPNGALTHPHIQLAQNHPLAQQHANQLQHVRDIHSWQAREFNQTLMNSVPPGDHNHYLQQMQNHHTTELQKLYHQHQAEIRNQHQ